MKSIYKFVGVYTTKMPTTDEFRKAYQALNSAQKEAVDTIEGPVMVIAGPGTGKTQVLTLRVAQILLKTDTPPDGILVLTFTEAAATALRERLVKLIGSRAYQVRIHTFHGFAESVIREYPASFPRIIGGTLLGDVERVEIVRNIIDARSFEEIKPYGDRYYYVNHLRRFIQDLKREGYSPEVFLDFLLQEEKRVTESSDFIHEKGAHKGKIKSVYATALARIKRHKEACEVYREYEAALARDRRYDFEDLIGEVVKAFQGNEELLRSLQEKFLYLLADEHQDANASQNALLSLLASYHESPNIFIVGDEKQAIYRFQGAALDTFLSLKEKYPQTKVIILSENYRSRAPILKAADALIAPAPIPDAALRVPLRAQEEYGPAVRIVQFETEGDERVGIVQFVREKVAQGRKYEDIVVLVRRNTDAVRMAEVFADQGIKSVIAVDQDALRHPVASLFRALLTAIAHPGDDVALSRALFAPGIPLLPEDVTRILSGRRRDESLISLMASPSRLTELGISDPSPVERYCALLKNLSKGVHALSLHGALSRIVRETGFLQGVLALPDGGEAYRVCEGFFAEADTFTEVRPEAHLSDFLERLALMEHHELSISRGRPVTEGVSIMTAHKAKGLEFPYVAILHATDTRWGKSRTDTFSLVPTSEPDEHDERRLLYVALTRAKEEAIITYAKKSASERSVLPSRFLTDIASCTEQQEEPSFEASVMFGDEVESNAYRSLASALPFLRERFLSQGLSVTALNNFLVSPWQYFFRNLLRIPEERGAALLFGDAVHAGLRAYFETFFKSGVADIPHAEKVFAESLRKNAHSGIDVNALIPRGIHALRTYLALYGVPTATLGHTEYSIQVPYVVPGVGEITLRGTLDRIDLHEGNKAVVIDYKTGKSKSLREIRGETAKQDRGYFRQLAFYGLLLSRDGRWSMDEARLDFVEPSDAGKITSHGLSITKEDILTLEEEITRAVQEIYSFEFLKTSCNSDSCDYCDLADAFSKHT